MHYKCERFQPAQGLKLNGLNSKIEWGEWGGSLYRVPIHPVQIYHPGHSVCGPLADWNISYLYLVKLVQITGNVSQVELIMWTRQTVLSGRRKNLQKK